jgi:hypothetical protein
MFDIIDSQRRARQRLTRTSTRRRRSDAGRSRLPPAVLAELQAVALGMDRPRMAAIQRRLARVCARHGVKMPSRASVYNTLSRIEGHSYVVSGLPDGVREGLYNLAATSSVPGRQLVFHCFNYGSVAAVSYAAGLPWIDLYQAERLRGWRPRSLGLLRAVMAVRGIH